MAAAGIVRVTRRWFPEAAGSGIPQQFFSPALGPALIAMGMVGFPAAVTQAPSTAFIIVRVDGHSMVLSLMASAMLASLASRMVSGPLYETLADHRVSAANRSSEEAQDVPATPTLIAEQHDPIVLRDRR